MTPGQEALIEAMRLEQARIYSQTAPEHKRNDEQPAVQIDTHGTVHDLAERRTRRSA